MDVKTALEKFAVCIIRQIRDDEQVQIQTMKNFATDRGVLRLLELIADGTLPPDDTFFLFAERALRIMAPPDATVENMIRIEANGLAAMSFLGTLKELAPTGGNDG